MTLQSYQDGPWRKTSTQGPSRCLLLLIVCGAVSMGACASSTRCVDLDRSVVDSAAASSDPSPDTIHRTEHNQAERGVVVAASHDQPEQTGFGYAEVGDSNRNPVDADNEESPPERTMEHVLTNAIAEHPLLAVRRHEVAIARARLVSAGLLPNPQLVMDTENRVQGEGPTELATRITFEIPTAGKRRLRQAVAQSEIRRAQAALKRETEMVLLEAADAAIDILYWQELLRWRTQLAEIAAEKAKLVKSSFDNRELRIADAVEAECDAADADGRKLKAQCGLGAARLRLAKALGVLPQSLPEITGIIQVDDGPLMSLDNVLDIARRNCSQLAEACAALNESRHRNQLAYAERFPNLSFGPRFRDRLGEADDEIGARFEVDLPLFDRNQGQILESAAEAHADRARVRAAEVETLGSIAEAYFELREIHGVLAAQKSGIMEQVDRYDALLRDPTVEQGMSVIQTLEIRQRLVQTRIKHLELRYRYLWLRTQLESPLGVSICSSRQTSPAAANPGGQ